VLPVPIRVIEVAPDRNPTVLLAEVFEASRRIFDFLNGIMFVREPRPKTTAPGGPAQARPWSASMMPDPRWLDALKLPDKVVAGLFPAALLVLGLDYFALVNLADLAALARPIVIIAAVLFGSLSVAALVALVYGAVMLLYRHVGWC
jgi:hypothetical protein